MLNKFISFALISLFLIPVISLAETQAETKPEQQQSQKPQSIHFVGSKYYPPLEWSEENNQAQGFITELKTIMAQSSNTPHSITLGKWSDALDSVLDGTADATALIPSEERARLYDFTQPFYYIAHGIFSHADGPSFGSLDQLQGHTVAVVKKSFGENKLQQASQSDNLNLKILSVETELACISVVANRQADACIEVVVSSNQLARMYDLPVRMTSPPIWPQPYVFAVKKGNTRMLNLLNEQLATVVVNGEYTSLYRKWAHTLEWAGYSKWDMVLELAQLFLAFIVFVAIVLLWNLMLRRRVQKRTAQLQQELNVSNELRLQVLHQANHDFTTDLLNRRAFFERLNNDIAALKQKPNKSLSILAIQITNIADIITAFGYESALITLNNVANKLRAINNTYAAHFGSGHYVLCFDSHDSAQNIIRELRLSNSEHDGAIEPLLNFAASHLSPTDITGKLNASELVRRAITALAYATKKRLAFFEYNPSIDPEGNNLLLVNEFYRYGCQHFVLHYQPQMCAQTGHIMHAEALVRWNHPELGMIAPYKFISLLENSGLIHVVTRWVIEQAVAMIQRNQLEQKNCAISVNISTRDLIDDGFVGYVKQATQSINPASLILEITESDLFDDAKRAKQAIIELREIGIHFAVDDYGTGYSTLSYLNELTVDEIKLDRSFVFNIVENERSRKIVKSTIELAHELDLVIVAEGVEDQATLDVLRELGCDRIQGYLISKPMVESEIIKQLNTKVYLAKLS